MQIIKHAHLMLILLLVAGCGYDQSMLKAHTAADTANQAADDAGELCPGTTTLREEAYKAAIEANAAAEARHKTLPRLKLKLAQAQGHYNSLYEEKVQPAKRETVAKYTEWDKNKDHDDQLLKEDAAYTAAEQEETRLSIEMARASADAFANATNKAWMALYGGKAAYLKTQLDAAASKRSGLEEDHKRVQRNHSARVKKRWEAVEEAQKKEKAAEAAIEPAKKEIENAQAEMDADAKDLLAKTAAAEAAADALSKACPAINRRHLVPAPGSQSPGQDIFNNTHQQNREPPGH